MNKEKDIEDLLRKFAQGDLSAQEAKQLASLSHEGDTNMELKVILDNFWQKSFFDQTNVPSQEMWSRVNQNLPVDYGQKPFIQRTRLQKLMPFMKYAAVFILSVGLTWIAKDFLGVSFNKSSADDNNGDNNVITVSYGSKSKITLPDGSTVNLNSGSTLRYPAKFSRLSRSVYVDGEAFFDVIKDPKHPFYVKTRDITIKVLGTKFNVKSYADERTIQTTLVTGSIEIYSNKKEISEKNRLLSLQPNQQVTIEKKPDGLKVIGEKDKKGEKIGSLSKFIDVSKQIDVISIVAWKDNRLVFRDEKFADLSRKLERWYDVDIEIKDPELKTALFSGVFVKETIEQALDALKMATPFRYQIKRNQITISK